MPAVGTNAGAPSSFWEIVTVAHLLMPKATAVWLVDNTTLSFEQIAEFCGLHMLEVQAIADGEVAVGMVGMDPIANGQLTQAEIDRCQADPSARLQLFRTDLPEPKERSKGPRYIPVTKRGDKPDAIAYLLKTHPELTVAQICRLVGTTKPTIDKIRDKSHWNTPNIKPRSPVLLGVTSQKDLAEELAKAGKTLALTDVMEESEPEPETPGTNQDIFAFNPMFRRNQSPSDES